MRGISTFNLLLKGSLFAFSLGLANQSSAQLENACSSVIANFNSGTNGIISVDNSFTHTIVDGNGYYYRTIPRDSDTELDLVLTTPTYQNLNPGSTVYFGFDLSGYVQGTTYEVEILNTEGIVVATTGEILVNRNQNANAQDATICSSIDVPGLNTGDPIKYRITIHSPDPRGNGNTDVTLIFDNFSIGGIEAIILPVDIISFSAKKVTRGTQLAWNIANEINVSRYEVQKSGDGGSFKTIGHVFAGEKSSYTFTDEQSTPGTSFYRIRSVDNDGKYKFSTIISFSDGKSAALLRAFPMPARNQVTLQHGTIEGKAQITISSESGQIIKRVVPATGSMQTSIDLSSLKAGLYLLRLENSNGEVETLKVVKQ